MSKTYRPYYPEQQLRMLPALQEWLPADLVPMLASVT